MALMRCERYGAPALLIELLRFLLIRPIDHVERHSSFEHFGLEVGCMGFPFGVSRTLNLGSSPSPSSESSAAKAPRASYIMVRLSFVKA